MIACITYKEHLQAPRPSGESADHIASIFIQLNIIASLDNNTHGHDMKIIPRLLIMHGSTGLAGHVLACRVCDIVVLLYMQYTHPCLARVHMRIYGALNRTELNTAAGSIIVYL